MGRAGTSIFELELDDVTRFALDTIDVTALIAEDADEATYNFLYQRPSLYKRGDEQPYLDALSDLLSMEGMTLENLQVREGAIGDWVTTRAIQSDPVYGDERYGFDPYARPYLLALGAASPISDFLVRHRNGTLHVLTSSISYISVRQVMSKMACGKKFDPEHYETGIPRGSFTADGVKICKSCGRNVKPPTLYHRDAHEQEDQLKVLGDFESKRAKRELGIWTNKRLVKIFKAEGSRERIAKKVNKLFFTEIPAQAAELGRQAAAIEILRLDFKARRAALGISAEIENPEFPSQQAIAKALATLDLDLAQEQLRQQLQTALHNS